ncbi:siderophore ABC transporter substrate-binding protein [Alkalicoccobacillus porphyridii]|uniref:Siderophore ABC transporter substrate-binding protein n=1 Tax=Alkalicoccobacillus porphyridii TaxID=2597270 RepID=A0A554A1D5_9BACI|nr:siderophore ABC transporter substrate-binding protein [Alkalicoccobacillus porphyridii]TSB47497.1 siderophore ABC transporter substrate-binding protein [Alkalicoccobacillus porphyridii]
MKKLSYFKFPVIAAVFTSMLVACSDSTNETTTEEQVSGDDTTETSETVEITDAHGTVEVPVNPETVVALDNRTFETLSDFDVELAAAPKDVMHADTPYASDDSVENIGNHREPNLEIIAAADPDLVIVGQRFASFYEDIKELVPNSTVIDLNIDVSEEADAPGENFMNGLTDYTLVLGQIFDKTAEAEALEADFNQAMEDVKAAYNGTDTVMSVIVSGGDINYAAPHNGRVWGPLYDIFEFEPALEVENTTSDHQGDDVSVESIAQSNPDWLLVLDRDAAVSAEDSSPATDVIEGSPALQNTTAISEGHVFYAPDDTYTTESIQTYIEMFEDLANALN